MKKFKKMMAIVLSLAVVLAFSVPTMVFAAETTGTITITPPSGLDANATSTYKVYKIFDAVGNGTSISYKLVSGKTQPPTGFVVDSAGNVHYGTAFTDKNGNVYYGKEVAAPIEGKTTTINISDTEQKIIQTSGFELTSEEIEAIGNYVTDADLVDTVITTGTTAGVTKALPNGYYYITTTTGTVVTIDSTNPTAAVEDKNSVPSVDKKITGASSIDENGKKALAQVGTTVNYSAEITIGTGAKGYIFHDTMETGLKYNGDAAVTGVAAGDATYTVGKEGDDTFTITFADTYVKTLEAGSKLTVTYSATVTSDAITTDPLNNTCYVSYGDKNSNNKTPESSADVYEAKFTVTKKDGEDKPLQDAGFVIKNASGAYYKTTAGTDGSVVSWYTLGEDETLEAAIEAGKVTEYKSDAQGAVAPFKGLANGTYTLVESTVPEGYNKAADQNFTVAEHDYTAANLEQTATVINNSGAELPSTGGIGTTIFYVLGALLVVGAGVLLVTRRRMKTN